MIREMALADYEQMIELWNRIDGLAISEADSKDNIALFLSRNKGLSLVYEAEGKVVGTVMCGHDGRRGFIYHVAVDPSYRQQGIAQRMVEKGLAGLQQEGIAKCHIFVLDDNEAGNRFWSSTGWEKRSGFSVYTSDTERMSSF